MVRVLQVTTTNVTVKRLLLPLIDRLMEEGYQVTSACCPGTYASELEDRGYSIQPIEMVRCLNPRSSLRTIWRLYRLMRQEQADIVHVHTPIAAALGRIAAWMARIPIIVYTAHGFYHHEHMPWPRRTACIWIERMLGRATDMLFTQSQEDAISAVRDRINSAEKVTWIGNGVDVVRFNYGQPSPQAKKSFGLPSTAPVVGFLGPLIAEKGVLELVDAFQQALMVNPDIHLLLAGDVLDGDRDLATKAIIRRKVENSDLASRVICPGYQEDISRFMEAIDVFVLPSHREGMPRSIIEAMSCGKPVVATDIRGCREEVIHEVTGLLVPIQNPGALADAMVRILSDRELSHRMGVQGRQRAEAIFNERDVLGRQVRAYKNLVEKHLDQEAGVRHLMGRRHNTGNPRLER